MGKFLVIEGMDGSGKSTQTKKLEGCLKERGLKVKTFHFPSGKGFYGEMVNSFLRGDLGEADSVDPYFAAMLFAGDRKEMANTVRQWINAYDVLLLDRYAYSNIAYQCAKLGKASERDRLRNWIIELEFEVNRIPRPDMNIFLGVPQRFIETQLGKNRKGEDRQYLGGKSDIHEKDMDLQKNVGSMYRLMCREYDEMVYVNCADSDGKMLNSEVIHKRILKEVNKLLEQGAEETK